MPSEEMQRIFYESDHDFSSDICSGATISDFDENTMDVFRNKWAAKTGNKRIKNLSIEQVMTNIL